MIAEMRAGVAATSTGGDESHYNGVDGGSPLEPSNPHTGKGQRCRRPGKALRGRRPRRPRKPGHVRQRPCLCGQDVVAICWSALAKIHQAMAVLRQDFATAAIGAVRSGPASSEASPATSKRGRTAQHARLDGVSCKSRMLSLAATCPSSHHLSLTPPSSPMANGRAS